MFFSQYDTSFWKIIDFIDVRLSCVVLIILASLFGQLKVLLLLFFSHSLGEALVGELRELLDDLDLLCYVGMTVKAVEIVLELSEVVRSCVVGVVDLLVVNTPGLVGL